VNELFSKLKSAEVDRGMTAKLEGPNHSHSLALVGGSKGKANTNPSTRMFSLSSLMSIPDEEFDVLREDEMALLMRRFKRLHKDRVNTRKTTRTCFQCGKPGHFVVDYPEKVENKDGYKHKSKTDGKYRSRRDHKNKHKDERRSRKKESRGKARVMVGASEVVSSSAYSTSSSSSSEDEGDRRKSRKSSKNLSGLSCFARDDFCTIALSSDSKKSTQSDSDSIIWTSLGPLPRWVPGPTTRWAPRTTRLALHSTCWREAQGLQRRSTRLGSCTCPALYKGLLDVLD
jgi:hypothetical protein